MGASALLLSIAHAAQPVEFHRDVAPILFAYCSPCHHPGAAGPFPLLSYADARKHARQIATVTRSRYMPPWLPEPGYGEFEAERRLTEAQIRTIEQWVRAGAAEGPPSNASSPSFTEGWELGEPDMVISIAKPVTAPAEGSDVFWNFIVSPGVRETRYVQAIEIRPGNTRAVHHANLLIDRSRSARLRDRDSVGGFAGMDVTLEATSFDPDSHFLFWKPGGVPWREPADMAWRLDPGNDLVLNVHVHPTGKPEIVQPSIGLYFSRQRPSKFPMLLQLEHDGAIDIPPGERDFVVSDDFRLPMNVEVLAVYPHAHYLGKLLEGFATLPDGKRAPLVRIPNWDLNWQAVYRLRKSMFLPRGSVVSMRFHYDNSAENPRNPNSPPKRVQGGNQSTDEMAHLWLQVLPAGGGDQRTVLQQALMEHRLEKYPADFLAHFNLGALLLKRHETAPAIAHLGQALLVEPENPAALNTYGVALEWAGRSDEAEDRFRHVLRLRPEDASARYNLAGTLVDRGLLDDAAVELRKALTIAPDDRDAHTRLVQVLKELADRSAAEGPLPASLARYRELVALEPEDADLHNNFGILLARSGDFDSAISQFEAALKLNPGHQAARGNLAVARKKASH